MSNLSTILNRIRDLRKHYRRFPAPSGLTTNPQFLHLIRNTQEYQALWNDYTEEEADAANTIWEIYKEHLKPEDQKSASELRAAWNLRY